MKLVCTRGATKSQEWNVDEVEVSIGRDPLCTVVLDDPKVSRIHCEIKRADGQHVLVDRNSTNGTYVNGIKVSRHELRAGDVMLVGNTEFKTVPTDTLDEVRWEDEANPSITLTIPIESMVRKLEEFQSPKPEQVAAQAAPARRDASTVIRTKLLTHLQIVYELSRTLSRIMAIEELYNFLSQTLFGVFADVERICIVLRSEDGNYHPVMVRSRDKEWTGEFTISNAIFEQAVQNSVGILALDALRDTRFRKYESVASLNIRSVMCAPLIVKSEAIGALYVDNRTRENCFAEEDLELLTSIAAQAATAVQNARLFDNLQRAYHQIILSLINAIEAKDPYTYGHHKRVCEYAVGIGQEMHLSPEGMDCLHRAAELHDIGKIGVQERLIQKPGSLTESEVISFQAHVLTGEKILSPVDYLQDIVPVVRQHHEHFNGKGYPDGLSGDEILIEARVLAVADSFDAMTTQRTYNRPVGFGEALRRCREKAGSQFDPQVVEALDLYLNHCHFEKLHEPESEEPPCSP
jgi:HD-GYP domain-containing protein (c-di-GMP phosphodiesterase class II)/pSer/pThr/pTyr-binding forkhead associated (FHA) protein